MIPESFEYLRPRSLAEAVTLLERHGEDARILSGGHSLIPAMKLRLATPRVLIDIGRLSELNYLEADSHGLRIGALTTHRDIAASEAVRIRFAALRDAAARIGDVQIRNKGTIGGSLAHADPAADYPAAILAGGATIVAAGPAGDREIPSAEFFVDMLTSSLVAGEIVREVRMPRIGDRSATAYVKMSQRASGFAMCGAAAMVSLDEGGRLDDVAIGITGVGSSAYRATRTEDALRGKHPDDTAITAAAAHAADGVVALDDIHASAEYRINMAATFTRRAIQRALERLAE
jgi:carbon-monoxide dehydrogenase medium subunit